MEPPSRRCSGIVVGWPATRSSYASKPSMLPPAAIFNFSAGEKSVASAARSANWLVQHDAHGPGVVENATDLAGRGARIERNRTEPTLLRGQLPDHHVDAVREVVRDRVPGREAAAAQRVHELVGASGELAECQCQARRGGRDRGKVGVVFGDPPHAQPLAPRVRLARGTRVTDRAHTGTISEFSTLNRLTGGRGAAR